MEGYQKRSKEGKSKKVKGKSADKSISIKLIKSGSPPHFCLLPFAFCLPHLPFLNLIMLLHWCKTFGHTKQFRSLSRCSDQRRDRSACKGGRHEHFVFRRFYSPANKA